MLLCCAGVGVGALPASEVVVVDEPGPLGQLSCLVGQMTGKQQHVLRLHFPSKSHEHH